jgi:hypothetical protein
MSANTPNNQDQEIDLSIISKKIGIYFENVLSFIFNVIQYVKKNILILILLIVAGAGLGYLSDESNNNYASDVIVSPNFGCTDYVYDKINLLNSRIGEGDTVFCKSIGLLNASQIQFLEVEPIIDIYSFVNNNSGQSANNAQNSQNFELVKLLSEDGDIKKVIKDELTSKNYSHHLIHVVTNGLSNNKNTIDPIINYLNKSAFYEKYRKTYIDNINNKIKQNDLIINQIDGVLNQFTSNSLSNQKSDKLVYYNENTQLNDIIKTKDGLINESGYLKNQLVLLDKVVKENSRTTNIKLDKGLRYKLRFFMPIIFIFGYIGLGLFISFYKKQAAKV